MLRGYDLTYRNVQEKHDVDKPCSNGFFKGECREYLQLVLRVELIGRRAQWRMSSLLGAADWNIKTSGVVLVDNEGYLGVGR